MNDVATLNTKLTRNWKCQECGKKMSAKAAEKAMSDGCPKCGGSDIDVDTPKE